MTRQRARPGPAPRTPEQSYLFRIIRCEPSYSMRIRNFPGGKAPLEEYAHPHIIAECQFPKKLVGRETDFVLIGRRSLHEEFGHQATSVGMLRMRGTTSEFLAALPIDVLGHLLTGVMLGGYRFIALHGAPLHRGEADINSMSFENHYEVSELEGG